MLQGTEPGSVKCKESTLYVVLSLQLHLKHFKDNEVFNENLILKITYAAPSQLINLILNA